MSEKTMFSMLVVCEILGTSLSVVLVNKPCWRIIAYIAFFVKLALPTDTHSSWALLHP